VGREQGLDDVRVEDVLVVNPADRFAEELRQRLDLFMGDQVRPLRSDRRRESILFRLAERRAILEGPVEPHGRGCEDIREEDLAGVEWEGAVADRKSTR